MEEKNLPAVLGNDSGTAGELTAKKEAYQREQQLFKESGQKLESLKKKIEREKDAKIRADRAEVEDTYDRQLRRLETEINRARTKRQGDRNKAEKGRIKTETAGLKAANEALTKELREILTKYQLPAVCGTRLFLVMYAARGLGEVLLMLLIFALLLIALPFLVTCFLHKEVWKVIAFVLIDAAVIGLYFLVYKKIAAPGKEGINLCHDVQDKIRANEKQIRKITKNIRNDKDDSRYNLVEYDVQLTRLEQEKTEMLAARQQALEEFDQVTAAKIRADVDGSYAEKLTKVSEEMLKHQAAAKQLGDEVLMLVQQSPADTLTQEKMQGPEETAHA